MKHRYIILSLAFIVTILWITTRTDNNPDTSLSILNPECPEALPLGSVAAGELLVFNPVDSLFSTDITIDGKGTFSCAWQGTVVFGPECDLVGVKVPFKQLYVAPYAIKAVKSSDFASFDIFSESTRLRCSYVLDNKTYVLKVPVEST